MIQLHFTEKKLSNMLIAFKLAIKHSKEVSRDTGTAEVLVEECRTLEQKIMNALKNDVVYRANAIGIIPSNQS